MSSRSSLTSPALRRVALVAVAAAGASAFATPAFAAAGGKKPVTTPAPAITAGPADGSHVASASASFSFTDSVTGSTFTCSLDGASFQVCKSPKAYSSLSAATHNFRVRAQAPGKKVSSAVSRSWTVDLHVPAPPTVSSAQADPTNSQTRPFTFTGESGATFECSVDGATFATCATPFVAGSTTPLAEGAHTLAVRQRATNGVRSAASSVAWTVDLTAPDAPGVNSAPTGTVSNPSQTFTFSDEDPSVAAYKCWVTSTTGTGSGGESDCNDGSFGWTASGNGDYLFHVVALDAATNRSGESTAAYTVNTAAPAAPVFQPPFPGAFTKSTSATFAYTVGDGLNVTCTLDGVSLDSCTSPITVSALADGAHAVVVTATDAQSGLGSSASYGWTVDTVAPAAPSFVGGQANGSFTRSRSVLFGISGDGMSTLSCTVDAGASATCPGFVNLTGLADGSHTVTVTATDAAGNTATTSRSWTVDNVAPTATLTPSTALRGTSVVRFNEPVRGVTASRVVLRATGTTTNLAEALTCYSGATVAPCSGAVDGARLVPTSRLVPGQYYSLLVASGITDRAGNAQAVVSKAFPRASRGQQENSLAASQTWRKVSTSSAYGGSYVVEQAPAATASYRFTGTSVTWWTVTGRAFGKAEMWVDGVRKASVNDYATSTHFHVARAVKGLPAGAHTLVVKVLGVKGSTAGTGTLVAVDAMSVGATRTDTPSLVTAWRRAADRKASGGAYAIANLAGATTSFVFRGTGVTWYTVAGRSHGKVAVYVDGVLKSTVDTYAATTTYNSAHGVGTLTNAVHTLRLVVLGTHRSGATGTLVVVDRYAVA